VTDDKTPMAGDLLGQGEPGRPAAGRGPNKEGELSKNDSHHPLPVGARLAWWPARAQPSSTGSHLLHGRQALVLPCLGRTEEDIHQRSVTSMTTIGFATRWRRCSTASRTSPVATALGVLLLLRQPARERFCLGASGHA
jgi:hypothetical protein